MRHMFVFDRHASKSHNKFSGGLQCWTETFFLKIARSSLINIWRKKIMTSLFGLKFSAYTYFLLFGQNLLLSLKSFITLPLKCLYSGTRKCIFYDTIFMVIPLQLSVYSCYCIFDIYKMIPHEYLN